MNKNYEAPQIEVIEIEVEDAVLQASGVESATTSVNSFRGDERAW